MKKLRIALAATALIGAGVAAWASNASNSSLVVQNVADSASPCQLIGTCDKDFPLESCQNATGTRRIRVSAVSCTQPVAEGRFTPIP